MSASFLKTYWSAIAKFFGLWVPSCCSVDDCTWIAKHSLRVDLPEKVWKAQIWCRNIRLTFGHLCWWDSHCSDQIPERNDLREKDWFYLHDFSLSQCGVLSGAQGFLLCCPGSREYACCIGYVFFPPFYLIQIPIYGIVLPTFREIHSFLGYPLWKHLHRYFQRYTSVF